MDIQPEKLQDLGYVQVDTLAHNQLIPFIQEYLKKNNPYTLFYKIFHLVLLVFLAIIIGYGVASKQIEIARVVSQLSFGFVIAFLLLPIHEGLHGWAYKRVGAQQVSYAAEWKKLYFMAIADKFVANRKEFVFVALLPFAFLVVLGLAASVFLPLPWMLTSLATVLVHGSMCGGDFGLLSYFHEKRHFDVVTFDDVPNKISYFYQKPHGN